MKELNGFKIGFIGLGHMGEIIVKSLCKSHVVNKEQLLFVRKDKKKEKESSKMLGISASSIKHIMEVSNIILFCIKPKDLPFVMEEISNFEGNYNNKFFISILAGVPSSYFTNFFGKDVQILRVMPNTASEISESMTIFASNKKISQENHFAARMLFSATGKIEEIDEKHMDLLTATAGSGPAFIYQLIDAFARKMKQEGLSYEKSLAIACQTFLGATKMVMQHKDIDKLTYQIAVPDGTTEAGLDAYRACTINEKIENVITASMNKAKKMHL